MKLWQGLVDNINVKCTGYVIYVCAMAFIDSIKFEVSKRRTKWKAITGCFRQKLKNENHVDRIFRFEGPMIHH